MAELVGRFGPEGGADRPIISLSSFLDLAPVPSIVVDLEGGLVFINRVARSVFSFSQDHAEKVPEEDTADRSAREPPRIMICPREEFQSALNEAGQKGKAIITLSLPVDLKGTREFDLNFLPLKDESGIEVGAVLTASENLNVERDMEGAIASLEILAQTSSGMVDSSDLARTISSELGKLAASLDMDFAIFRLTTTEGKATMICHGVDYRRGREILETRLEDDGPLYESVVKGDLFVSEDVPNDSRIVNPPNGVHSFACLTIRWMKRVYASSPLQEMEEMTGGSRSEMEEKAFSMIERRSFSSALTS